MPEKYDLKQMLKEIEEDEGQFKVNKNTKISQNDIKKMLMKKKKGANLDSKP
ncbi:MAG: hypothetical protein HQK76_12230 [Desulfobacterales bacterium]|nr:hypothetical protein [Desulfobacterales bacterium]